MSGPQEIAGGTGRPAWRRARREAARKHHPDRGGTVESYLAAIEQVDRIFGMVADNEPVRGSPVSLRTDRWTLARRSLARRLRETRRTTREARSRLWRGVPGARRYTDL